MIDGIIDEAIHGSRPETGAHYIRHRFSYLIQSVVAALLLSAPALTLGATADREKEKELSAVRERIEALQRSLRRDTDRRDALSSQLRNAEAEVRGARSRLTDVRKRIAQSDARLAELAALEAQNERKLDEERATLAALVRAAYVGGRQEPYKVLLSQEDPSALGRMLAYYAYFGRARAAKIAEIGEIVAALEAAAAAEAEERARLATLEAESRRELAAVDSARAARSKALRAMNAKIRTRSDSISKLKREAAALEKLIADLRKAIRDLPPSGGLAFEKVRGRLSWPVPGRLAARFGEPRGGGLKWNGVMIESERGTAVRALYDGRVAFADWLPGMGLLLIIDHGGYLSLYAHNEQLYRTVGDRVAGGEVVGTVGDSGGRSKTGLYLEIRRGAKAIDPVPWFRRSSP
jgi:septal ring factor EnvC (AmiA/AmiB activator)